MKKVKLIALTIAFCIASLGMSGTLHYCAGQIKTISMEQSKHKGCGSCDDDFANDKSCCSEKTTLFQYDDFQFQKASFNIQYVPSFIVTIPYFIPLDDSDATNITSKGHYNDLSFFSSSTDVQSRLCVFTI